MAGGETKGVGQVEGPKGWGVLEAGVENDVTLRLNFPLCYIDWLSLWCHFRTLLLCGAPSLCICRGHCVSGIAALHPLYMTQPHTTYITTALSHPHIITRQWHPTPSQSHPHTLSVPYTTSPHHPNLCSLQSTASKGKLSFGRLLRKAGAVDDERECADFVRLKVCA